MTSQTLPRGSRRRRPAPSRASAERAVTSSPAAAATTARAAVETPPGSGTVAALVELIDEPEQLARPALCPSDGDELGAVPVRGVDIADVGPEIGGRTRPCVPRRAADRRASSASRPMPRPRTSAHRTARPRAPCAAHPASAVPDRRRRGSRCRSARPAPSSDRWVGPSRRPAPAVHRPAPLARPRSAVPAGSGGRATPPRRPRRDRRCARASASSAMTMEPSPDSNALLGGKSDPQACGERRRPIDVGQRAALRRQHPSALERRAMLMDPQPAQAERGFGRRDAHRSRRRQRDAPTRTAHEPHANGLEPASPPPAHRPRLPRCNLHSSNFQSDARQPRYVGSPRCGRSCPRSGHDLPKNLGVASAGRVRRRRV